MLRPRPRFPYFPAPARFAHIAVLACASACVDPAAEPIDEPPSDFRCGHQGPPKKVEICHNGHTISVAQAAIRAHLRHGDELGACPSACTADSCDDGDLCTSDACLPDGSCTHDAVSCNDGNPCTADACEPATGCGTAPIDGIACEDGNECTQDDSCFAGACAGEAIDDCCLDDLDCDDAGACTDDACVDHACESEPVVCGSADPCLAGFCDPASGECGSTPVSCDDANSCTEDACEPGSGCTSTMVCTEPTIEPTHSYPGVPFVISDPARRMLPGDQVTFYLPSTAPANGISTTDCVVAPDFMTIRCRLPGSLDARTYSVAVKPSPNAESRFDDLMFIVDPD